MATQVYPPLPGRDLFVQAFLAEPDEVFNPVTDIAAASEALFLMNSLRLSFISG